jgi:Ca2+-binding EF-hand superfamily protein
MKKAIFLSLLTAIAGLSIASAQPPAGAECKHGGPGMAHGMPFEKLDSNKDGSLSRAELVGSATERFDRADANKDGTVTADERKAAHQRFADEHVKQLDKNGDGVLASDEIPPHLAAHLGKLDSDKDGKLTQAELAAMHAKFAARFAEHDQPDAAKTRAEMLTHVNARFDKLDTNKDGALSPEEFGKGYFWGHRGHMRHRPDAGTQS